MYCLAGDKNSFYETRKKIKGVYMKYVIRIITFDPLQDCGLQKLLKLPLIPKNNLSEM
jgi:hypothetical protein